jgi:hypothetical protein
MEKRDVIWFSWDWHRRTVELSQSIGVPLRVIRCRRFGWPHPWWPLAKWWALAKTFWHLWFHNYRIVLVQNPSLLLTTAACLLKPLKGYAVVQDLHSYFAWRFDRPRGLRGVLYKKLTLSCIRHANLTIVTNGALKKMIDALGGRGFVLQDRIPQPSTGCTVLRGPLNIVFVCTYSADEPVTEVLEAARLVAPDVTIYVTGKRRKKSPGCVPDNVVLTDYLAEEDYWSLLNSCDAVMVLTTREHTLLCGAYEAITLLKPLILSDTKALRAYFSKGVVYTQNNRHGLAEAIRQASRERENLAKDIAKLRQELEAAWSRRLADLTEILDKLYYPDEPVSLWRGFWRCRKAGVK